MVTAYELALFAEKNGWIVIEKADGENDSFVRYLTPSGQRVLVKYNKDGSLWKVYP